MSTAKSGLPLFEHFVYGFTVRNPRSEIRAESVIVAVALHTRSRLRILYISLRLAAKTSGFRHIPLSQVSKERRFPRASPKSNDPRSTAWARSGTYFLHGSLSRKGLFALSLMREFQARSSVGNLTWHCVDNRT